jgi:hypothetical protein
MGGQWGAWDALRGQSRLELMRRLLGVVEEVRFCFGFVHGFSWLSVCLACMRVYYLGRALAPHRPLSTTHNRPFSGTAPLGAVRTALCSTAPTHEKPRSSLSVRRRVDFPRGRLADAAADAAAAAAGAGSALAPGARRRERTSLHDENRSTDYFMIRT